MNTDNSNSKEFSDLDVSLTSLSLKNIQIDLIVSGSIAAIESVRLIRQLRRLGAIVTPWLTSGGSQFITSQALSWAANNKTITKFEHSKSHISTGDLCIISPASASLIARSVYGFTSSAEIALIMSYLGMSKPVIAFASMHQSMANAKSIKNNLTNFEKSGAILAPARFEEGKRKFPDPIFAANYISHTYNNILNPERSCYINIGSSKALIDDVRYIGNYSSGALGTKICEELYRYGIYTHIAIGEAKFEPLSFNYKQNCITHKDFLLSAQTASEKYDAGIFCAAINDYEPLKTVKGKIRSKEPSLNISLVPTKKIIPYFKAKKQIKIGFKLEVNLNSQSTNDLAKDYMSKYNLSMFVINDLKNVDEQNHTAFVYTKVNNEFCYTKIDGKDKLAQFVARHAIDRI